MENKRKKLFFLPRVCVLLVMQKVSLWQYWMHGRMDYLLLQLLLAVFLISQKMERIFCFSILVM